MANVEVGEDLVPRLESGGELVNPPQVVGGFGPAIDVERDDSVQPVGS